MSRDLTRLRRELEATWRRSDALFSLIAPEALLSRPIALRHPVCFYIGHLPAFAWNQVGAGLLGLDPVDETMDNRFSTGIDPLEVPDTTSEQWPDISQITSYRDVVRQRLAETFDTVASLDDTDPLAANGRIYDVVIEHELMHHETLLYMFPELPHHHKRAPTAYRRPAARTPPGQERCYVPAGGASIGANWREEAFLWDNETPRRDVRVDGFHVDRFPVTNAAYARFVDVGGYQQRRWWDEEGWDWVCRHDMSQPRSWQGSGSARTVRSTFEDLTFHDALALPVRVSHVEASAYARFCGGRLPTEAELRRAALMDETAARRYPWGRAPLDGDRANAGQQRWTLTAVDAHPAGSSAWGLEDTLGNGWEWTSTAWLAQPGFRPWIRTYPGYSADFFDGRHRVMFGASWATAERLLRPSFRNWFHRRYPYVFSKFRVVNSSTSA